MKKTLSLVLALVLCVGASIAFADSFGLGVVTSIGSSKPAYVEDGENYDGRAQVDTTICSVILDDNGVILDIHFDVAQTRVDFAVDGALLSDLTAEQQTKLEKQDAYGMRNASPIGAELFEQVIAFEQYCIGKVAADVVAMETEQRDENHLRVPTDADLLTSCTIDIGAYLDALAKAVANAAAGH